MKVITNGMVEIGTLELNEVGQDFVSQAVEGNVPLRIFFDARKEIASLVDRTTVSPIELTLAAIIPEGIEGKSGKENEREELPTNLV